MKMSAKWQPFRPGRNELKKVNAGCSNDVASNRQPTTATAMMTQFSDTYTGSNCVKILEIEIYPIQIYRTDWDTWRLSDIIWADAKELNRRIGSANALSLFCTNPLSGEVLPYLGWVGRQLVPWRLRTLRNAYVYLKPMDRFSAFKVLWNCLDLKLCNAMVMCPFAS